ncbi:MAG: YeeE/YedE family protein [Achromobacter xylosoxidans]|nr:YeeE/YedE family protein [Achromobacter xylosoxidans]
MVIVFAFIAGLVFGLGLIVSGMANPAKVLGFLDLTGAWDPSLALVMGGALAVTAVGFTWLRRRRVSVSGEPMQWPGATRLDWRLALGSLTFGAGWGLAGFCPGPALVAAAAGVREALVFVAAMAAGMALFSIVRHFNRRPPRTGP